MLFEVATTSSKGGSPLIIIIYVVLFGGLYFFYLRPRSRRQKAARTTSRQVEIGDQARTIGGLIGTVVNRTDEAVTLRTASGVELDFIPSAIAGRHVPPGAEVAEPAEGESHADGEEHSSEGDDK